MVQDPQKTITLDEFLQLPETKPASEYINGAILEKPMPKGKHSKLQGRLVTVANDIAEKPQIALALPELRCTFGGRSIIPDVAIFVWNRIPLDADGEFFLFYRNRYNFKNWIEYLCSWNFIWPWISSSWFSKIF